MWLTCSSIGRKLVMSITGICLVLFVTFHCLMNAVALFWPMGYNAICAFLGANWYALIASVGLAALFIIHICYALWLTIQNRRARGYDPYEVRTIPNGVEWSSQNMLVLGFVVLAFLVVHMIQFWAKMQLAEILHCEADGIDPAAGTLFIHLAFQQIWTPIVYIIAFVALWFHLNHGFWSMLHSVGWDNDVWIKRLKCIGLWWTSIVVALFIAQAIVFTVRAHTNDFNTEVAEFEQWKNGEEIVCVEETCTETFGCAKEACESSVCPEGACAQKGCAQAGCTPENCADCAPCRQADCTDCSNCPVK